MARVSLRNLHKNYGSVQVLQDVNLEFEDGEFVVLVGPSGCGKSTLLRMIAGLETITDGTIAINGEIMNTLEARERDIAMVFQSYALYPHLTVAQNIGFPLRVRGHDPDDIRSQVERVAAMTGLDDLLDRKPVALSGGQRQRVAMGRAIIRSPKVFLFDEPLSNLDAKLRVQMRLQIRELHREVGATSVYVTHDQAEAMTLADRVVLLNDGVVQQAGTPLELYEQPANTFVAAFIGSPEMNLIPGRVEQNAGATFVELDEDNRIEIPPALACAVQPGQQIVIGIRPEDLIPADTGLSAQFRDCEHMGSETHIFGTVGNMLLTCVCRGTYHYNASQPLHFQPDSTKLHLFNAEDSRQLRLA